MMKIWKNILLVFLLLSLFCVSCCGLKKTKTITETIIQVDTIIKIVTDTVLKTVSVPLYDTAFIETEKVIVRSYFNVKTQKIDLQLKGKVFEVPVKLNKTDTKRKHF